MTRAMAQRAADELLSKGANNPTFTPTSTITFTEFVEQKLIPGAFPARKAGGAVTAKSILKHHLIPWFGEMPLAVVKAEAAQRMVSKLIEGGMCGSAIAGVCSTLSSVFVWAKRWGYPVAFNRSDLMLPKVPRKSARKLKFFSLEETLQIIDSAGPFYGLIFLTQCGLALRPGEVLALRVGDFNFEAGTVMVEHSSGAAYGNALTTTKGNTAVSKPLDPEIAARLQEYLRTAWKANPLGLLFPSQKAGKVMSLNFLRQNILYPVLGRLKIARQGRSLHAFRHTAASLMGKGGASAKVVGSMLSHQDGGELALRVYTHVMGNEEVEAMRMLGTAVCGSPRRPDDGQLAFDFAAPVADSVPRKPAASEMGGRKWQTA
jgi:integrase